MKPENVEYIVIHCSATKEGKSFDVEDMDRWHRSCLLYTSPSPRDRTRSRMPSSA